MKTQKIIRISSLLILPFTVFFASCKKETSVTGTTTDPTAITSAAAVAVGVSNTSGDSIYVVNTCNRDHHLDSIAASSLPSAITDYLNNNYAGYTFQNAFADKDSLATITGYVVIIQFNGNPVGLKFDASGNFVNVLEQREGHDLTGRGWHEGGRFGDRDGRHGDTVSLSDLPSSILTYFTQNYPADTLVKAYKTHDSSYVIFSYNNGVFSTTFDATGAFTNRVQLHNNTGNVASVDQNSLPSVIQTYLNTTYPNFVFKQAFSFSTNGVLSGYVVCIDANGTRYAVQFDASGNFVGVLTVR